MAKRFVFRLETLLKVRRQREEKHKRIVAERLRQITRVRDEIGTLDARIEDQIDAMRQETRRASIDVQNLARNRHWLTHLRRGRLEAEGRLHVLEAHLAQERAVLAHASKEKKVLEKLKERQLERYNKELDRREVIEADELSTTRHLLRRREALLEAVEVVETAGR